MDQLDPWVRPGQPAAGDPPDQQDPRVNEGFKDPLVGEVQPDLQETRDQLVCKANEVLLVQLDHQVRCADTHVSSYKYNHIDFLVLLY